MKTVQLSDELWRVLKFESVRRGVTLREVVEEAGAEWMQRQQPVPLVRPRVPGAVKELKVELEE